MTVEHYLNNSRIISHVNLGLVMKMHNPSLLRKTIYYGHPQFCEATGTIESCLESG